jgi:quinoprotein glucose dehydrogenase
MTKFEEALEDKDGGVAREAVRRLRDSAKLEKIAASDRPMSVRQAAVAALESDEALARFADAGLPAALQLEWVEVASKRPALKERAAKMEPSLLEGGDAKVGRKLFFERTDVQCVRCHKVGGEGGEVGPDLSKIGSQKDATYLLESILYPNKQIAEGWGQTAIRLANDSVEVGRVEKENEKEVVLVLSDGARKTIAKSDVKARKAALSAMPEDIARFLAKRDLRDLVAYLASLR